MLIQRIFWVLLTFFPNTVLADVDEAAILAQQTAITGKLETQMSGMLMPEPLPELLSVAGTVETAGKSFTAAASRASTMCLESTSPALIGLVSQHGVVLQGLGTMLRGMSDQCSETGKVIGLANAAIGAFQAQCGTVQALCLTSSATLTTSVTAYLTAAEAAFAQKTALSQMGDASAAAMLSSYKAQVVNATAMKATAAETKLLCGKYKIQLMQAATAGALGIAEVMKSSKCAEKTASAGIDCTDPKNAFYNQKNCRCSRNELTAAECQNITVGDGNGISGPKIELGGDSSASVVDNGSGGGNIYGVSQSTKGGGIDGSGGGMPGAPVGGGGGGAGASSGGGGAQDGAPTFGRRLNTNILGGGSGGGGGGGFGSGAGYGEDASLKAYAPGGAKDASRSVAAEVAKQVTNPGGRTNWEKVKNRYTENIRNLQGR